MHIITIMFHKLYPIPVLKYKSSNILGKTQVYVNFSFFHRFTLPFFSFVSIWRNKEFLGDLHFIKDLKSHGTSLYSTTFNQSINSLLMNFQ